MLELELQLGPELQERPGRPEVVLQQAYAAVSVARFDPLAAAEQLPAVTQQLAEARALALVAAYLIVGWLVQLGASQQVPL